MAGTAEEDPLDELPAELAVVIRLANAAASDSTIADALGIPVESVPGVRQVARAKLAALQARRDPGAPEWE